MGKIYCLNCGNEMDAATKFCPSCGAANTQREETVVQAVETEIKEDVNASTETVNETVNETVEHFTGTVEPTPAPQPQFGGYQNNTFNQQNQGGYTAAPNNANNEPSKALSIVSLVLGIISILCCWCFGFSGLLLSIAAVVCGIISVVKNFGGRGMAIAGIICGGIAIILSIITGAASNAAMRSGAYDDMIERYADMFDELGIDIDDYT